MSAQPTHHRARRALARSYERLSRPLTPGRTRRATWFERRTVSRLDWDVLVRLNRGLEFTGRVATGLLIAFLVSALLGVDWEKTAESALNSGRPIDGVLALIIIMPLLSFVALRSLIGFARWRLQRELWRRDVAELGTRPTDGQGRDGASP